MKFKDSWENELRKKKPSVIRGLWNAYKKTFLIATFLKFVQDSLQFASPVLLNEMIKYMNDLDANLTKGIIISLLFFFLTIIRNFCLTSYHFTQFRFGISLRASVVTSVYEKSLKLSNKSRSKYTSGQINNLMSVDSMKIQNICEYVQMIWSAPFQIIVAMILLWFELRWAAFGGVAVLLITIPLSTLVANRLQHYQSLIMEVKDERIKKINEMLNGIKIIKLQVWENNFIKLITKLRKSELGHLLYYWIFDSITGGFWVISPLLVSIASFGMYVLLGNKLTVAKAFTSLSLFNLIQFPMFSFPQVINELAEALVSVRRIQKFLECEEIIPISESINKSKPFIHINNGSFEWERSEESIERSPISPSSPRDPVVLQNINFLAENPEIIAIVGYVGCGKSSFLQTLLGDIKLIDGKIDYYGRIAYSSQTPFIQNASLRDNILFGKELNEEKYKEVLYNCALIPDLEILPKGDLTEIGEKGINLSGGQRARISLARALYSENDIYLLDDILSAVDVHVGKHIFNNAIKKGLNKKIVLLVTNAVEYLNEVDRIIVLNENKIVAEGKYDELMSNSLLFKSFIDELHKNSEKNKNNEDEDNTEESHLKRGESRNSEMINKMKDINKIDVLNEDDNNEDDLITTEEKQIGKVDWNIYLTYMRACCGNWFIFLVIASFYVIYQVTVFLGNFVLSYWSEDMENEIQKHTTTYYFTVFLILQVITAIFAVLSAVALEFRSLYGSKKLHTQLLENIIHCPMSFFDTTPMGRILNRFSREMDTIDQTLPSTFDAYFDALGQVLPVIIVIIYATPWFILVIIPIYLAFNYTQNYYLMSSREIKRLESISNSPIYSYFSETLTGVSTIRAYKHQSIFIKENEKRLNNNLSSFFVTYSANCWLQLRLKLIGSFIILFASLLAVFKHGDAEFTKIAALSLSYAIKIIDALDWMVRQATTIEMNIVSVERVSEYINIKRECDDNDKYERIANWPNKGEIEINNLKMRYRPELEPVLKNICCYINGEEKIGIVGRTGSGKSSLLLALLRIVDYEEGEIKIDGVNIKEIPIPYLREEISVIPQEPILFSGTIRDNIDPFRKYEDNDIWNILESCHIKELINEMGGLESEVLEKGSNLSLGQQQLLCIARAMIRRCKIIVMDEATSSIDIKTDSLIQDTITNHFKDRTVLTVAHRLNTILESDKVMVMENGKIVEYDNPKILENKEDSLYHKLVEQYKRTH